MVQAMKQYKIKRTCIKCGDEFLIHKSALKYTAAKFCTKKCQFEYMRGENSVLWDGGKTSEKDIIRKGDEYRSWRTAVFIRDDRICVFCGSKERIEADHIKPQALFPELRFDINNGRTLCRKCHEATPTYMNRWNLGKREDYL